MKIKSCVIFGGTGFIGINFTNFLLEHNLVDQVFLFDLKPITSRFLADKGSIKYIKGDVRFPINHKILPNSVCLIANFAAIHREPGHDDFEYYETNLLGAENVTNYAEVVGCDKILFTSSISPYGVSELVKDENTPPRPVTAYGASKLEAEKIHQIWQSRDEIARNLVIVRPGVVFGPGEDGNVSRLVKAVINKYFFYIGNRATRKAGVYVKELCNAMWWVLQKQGLNGEKVSLFNMTMNPNPTIKDYVDAVCRVKKINRTTLSVPYVLLLLVAYLIDFLAKPMRINHPFSPVRIRKLVRSNDILPSYLLQHGYQYRYSIDSAFSDWQKISPQEWE